MQSDLRPTVSEYLSDTMTLTEPKMPHPCFEPSTLSHTIYPPKKEGPFENIVEKEGNAGKADLDYPNEGH